MNNKVFVLLSVILVFLIGIVSAIPMPSAFYGEVRYGGELIPNGYTIIAKINNDIVASCPVIGGKYGIGENACIVTSKVNGVNIDFYIQDLKIGNSIFLDKEIIKLDFILSSLPQLPPSNENTGGTTPAPSGGGSGGGGGSSGGGSSSRTSSTTNSSGSLISETCVENWNCMEWSNSEQECGVRGCTDLNSCGTSNSKPVTIKECVEEESNGFFSFITGGVIGSLGTAGTGIIIFIILAVILALILLRFQKAKNKKKVKKK